jgi:cob(I)alamin adenosyltransferase
VRRREGIVVFYTGKGKGKTTAALGLAMRAVGAGLRVLVVQLIKGTWRYGELESAKRLAPALQLRAMGKGFVGIMGDRLPREEHVAAALEAVDHVRRELASGRWDMVVVDEVFTAHSLQLIGEGELEALLDARPPGVHMVMTGRGAPTRLFPRANIITEMRKVKHAYDEGLRGIPGIEF